MEFKTKIITKSKERHFVLMEKNRQAVIVGHISNPFQIKKKTTTQKINKDIENLKNTTNQLDLPTSIVYFAQ